MRWACNGLRNRCSETAITCANGLVQESTSTLPTSASRGSTKRRPKPTCIVYAVCCNLHATSHTPQAVVVGVACDDATTLADSLPQDATASFTRRVATRMPCMDMGALKRSFGLMWFDALGLQWSSQSLLRDGHLSFAASFGLMWFDALGLQWSSQ